MNLDKLQAKINSELKQFQGEGEVARYFSYIGFEDSEQVNLQIYDLGNPPKFIPPEEVVEYVFNHIEEWARAISPYADIPEFSLHNSLSAEHTQAPTADMS